MKYKIFDNFSVAGHNFFTIPFLGGLIITFSLLPLYLILSIPSSLNLKIIYLLINICLIVIYVVFIKNNNLYHCKVIGQELIFWRFFKKKQIPLSAIHQITIVKDYQELAKKYLISYIDDNDVYNSFLCLIYDEIIIDGETTNTLEYLKEIITYAKTDI